MKSFVFNGGVHPFEGKTLSNTQKIQTLPLPKRLILNLNQGAGAPAQPLVREGERVFKYQMIARAQGFISAALHAPTSGIIEHIGLFAHAHPSGLNVPSIVLIPDGQDEKNAALTVEKPAHLNEFACFLQNQGMIGLGGAGFPTHGKLKANLEALLINAAECEPMVTCDDVLMRERAATIIQGIVLLAEYLTPQRIIIGIEDNKPQAQQALQNAIDASGAAIEITRIPTLYPSGNAKHLAFLLTGKKIANSQRTTSENVQVFNIATVYAIACAFSGTPLVQRIVTVTGGVNHAANFEVLIGTPIADLLQAAQIKEKLTHVLHGGPMMGFPLQNWEAPVLKITNCLLAASSDFFPTPQMEMPCIRCTSCAKACPNELQPYALYWAARAKNLESAEDFHLFECMECGCCAYVCPSHIPLVHYFRFAKSEILERDAQRQSAEIAKLRFEQKQARQQREKEEKAQRLKQLAEQKNQKNSASTVEKT